MDTTALSPPPAGQLSAVTRSGTAVLPDPLPGLAPSDVISHVTAARLHGMPVIDTGAGAPGSAAQLHVSHPRKGGDTEQLHRWRNPVLPPDRLSFGALTVTTPARTVVDLSRDLGIIAGVLAADHLLRSAHDRQRVQNELHAAAETQQRRNRFSRVRMVLATATGESGSAAESVLLVLLRALGLGGFRQNVALPGAVVPGGSGPDGESAVSFLFPRLRVIIDVDRGGEEPLPGSEVRSELPVTTLPATPLPAGPLPVTTLPAAAELAAADYACVRIEAAELLHRLRQGADAEQQCGWLAAQLSGTPLTEEISPAAPGSRPSGAAGRT